MPRYFDINFVDEGLTAAVLLLDEDAPQTCEIVWKALPLAGECRHASFSGTSVALLFEPIITAPEENATNCIQTGDVMFTHYPANFRHGYHDPVSEVYWAYDRYCRPTMPGRFEPVAANVIGRIMGDATAFYDACARVRREGWKRVEITRSARE